MPNDINAPKTKLPARPNASREAIQTNCPPLLGVSVILINSNMAAANSATPIPT